MLGPDSGPFALFSSQFSRAKVPVLTAESPQVGSTRLVDGPASIIVKLQEKGAVCEEFSTAAKPELSQICTAPALQD